MARSPCLGLLTRAHCGPDVEKKISQPLGRQLELISGGYGWSAHECIIRRSQCTAEDNHTNCRLSPRRPLWVVGSASPTTPLHRDRDEALGLSVPSPWDSPALNFLLLFSPPLLRSSFWVFPLIFLFYLAAGHNCLFRVNLLSQCH